MVMNGCETGRKLPDHLKDIWDMKIYREADLEAERLSSRTVPLYVKGQNDWMATGDSWVVPSAEGDEGSGADDGEGVVSLDSKLTVEEYYFTSTSTKDKPSRIFCVLAKPEKSDEDKPVPVILVFHGGGGHGNSALAIAAARNNPGAAALAVDYNGQFVATTAHPVTQWGNIGRSSDMVPRIVPDICNCQTYHYVIAARRAMDFLETIPGLDTDRIGLQGISNGGLIALIAAGVDERVRCVVNGVSAGGVEGTASRSAAGYRKLPDEQKPLWLETYDPISYARYTKASVLLNMSSNDRFFWLSGAMRNFEALPGEKRITVKANADHNAGGYPIPDSSRYFVRHVLFGDAASALPRVTGDRIRYADGVFTWQTAEQPEAVKATLYYSPGTVVSPARYWMPIQAVRTGNQWQADLPEAFRSLSGQAYVTVYDERDRAASSMTVEWAGLNPATGDAFLWSGESVWDKERGADAWRPLTAGGGPKTLITGEAGGAVTFAPDGGNEFLALTNSVILASGRASNHNGLRLVVRGGGKGGQLRICLLRDSHSLDEVSYSAVRSYTANETVMNIPWSDFHTTNLAASAEPWPFSALQLGGTVSDGTGITLVSAVLY